MYQSIVRASRNTRGNESQLARATANVADFWPVTMLVARLTGSTAIGSTTNRWSYTWVEAWWNPAATPDAMADKSGGLNSTDCGVAYNLAEMDNTASVVGPEVDLANVPAGFSVQACEGHVFLYPHRGSDGALVWLFHKINAIDGTC